MLDSIFDCRRGQDCRRFNLRRFAGQRTKCDLLPKERHDLRALFMMSGLLVEGARDAQLALVWVCLATFGFGMWSANILHCTQISSQRRIWGALWA